MIQDLHAHTRYSFCGKDEPKAVVERAIAGGIDMLGITDHNYGIGERKSMYLCELTEIKNAYSDKIRLLRGIELATLPGNCLRRGEDISAFDFCIVEHIDSASSIAGANIAEYARDLKIPTGIAHTDLFGFMNTLNVSPRAFLASLASAGVFWELNVNYDSIHGYREHAYVGSFLDNEAQQRAVRESGVKLSVGFDGHRLEDYLPERVKRVNLALEKLSLPRVFID